MVEDYAAGLLETGLPGRIALFLEADHPLQLEFHRGERVLDLVRHLARHAAPGLVALRLGQFAGTLGQLGDHPVVGLHDGGDFVVPVVVDVFQRPEVRAGHLGTHLAQRLEHPVHDAGHHEQRHQQEQQEQRNDRQRVHHGILLEVEGLLVVRRAEDGQELAVRVEQRGVHAVEALHAQALRLDEMAAVAVDDVVVGRPVDAVRGHALVEHHRGRAHHQAAVRGVERDIGAGVAAHAVDQAAQRRPVHRLAGRHPLQAGVHHRDDGSDLVRHHRAAVAIVA